jgi:hypothetical protein
MLSRLRRLFEARGRVAPVWQQIYGEVVEIPFSEYLNAYLTDPTVKAVVDNLVAQVVGSGFYVTVEPPEAKDVLDDFNEEAAVDEWLQQVCREILIAGNSFTVKPDDWRSPPELIDLMLPLSTIRRIKRSEFGELQEIIQVIGGEEFSYRPDDVIYFCWNPVDRKAFGVGLLTPLLSPRLDPDGEVVPPLIKIKAQIENDMRRVLHKYPPRFLIRFNVSDERFEREIKPVLQSLKPGQDFATNCEVDVKEMSISSRASFEYMLEWLLNQIYLAFGTPLPRLLTTTGFTEASARAAVEASEAFRLMLQRFLKRRYERLVAKPVLEAYGYPDAKPRLHWGAPQMPEPTFQDLNRAFELGGIRLDEYRKNLQRFGFEIWDKPAKPAKPEEVV